MINGLRRLDSPHFLASVRSADEAHIALEGGADLIDCKDPANGALGALDDCEIAAICDVVGGRLPVSATVGDLSTEPSVMVAGAKRVAAAGADFVKIGFFGDAPAEEAIGALGAAELGHARLVGVLMADRAPNFTLIAELARAGFAGVMIDTADKTSGALFDVIPLSDLQAFIGLARRHGLAVGLAGSLTVVHIQAAVALRPDIIGFRRALCEGARAGQIELARVEEVRDALAAPAAGSGAIERSVA